MAKLFDRFQNWFQNIQNSCFVIVIIWSVKYLIVIIWSVKYLKGGGVCSQAMREKSGAVAEVAVVEVAVVAEQIQTKVQREPISDTVCSRVLVSRDHWRVCYQAGNSDRLSTSSQRALKIGPTCLPPSDCGSLHPWSFSRLTNIDFSHLHLKIRKVLSTSSDVRWSRFLDSLFPALKSRGGIFQGWAS